jgi:hypothetical protein
MVTVKSIAAVEKMKLDFCKPFALEIVGLYPIMKTLPRVPKKALCPNRFCSKNGFVKVDSGMGNWQNGPRFVYSAYAKGKCKCEVYKKYDYNKNKLTVISICASPNDCSNVEAICQTINGRIKGQN